MDMQTKAAQATRNRRGVMMLPLLAAVAVAAITIIPVVRWCMAFINGTENINAQLEMQSIIQEYYSKVSAASYEELQATIASKGTTWTEDVGGKYTLTVETSEAGKFENALCNLDEAAGAYDRACMKANITLVSKADPSRTVGMQVTRVATLNQLAELADKIEAEGERFADYYTKAEADAQYACPWDYHLVRGKCVACPAPSNWKQYRSGNCTLGTCSTGYKANAAKTGCEKITCPSGKVLRGDDCVTPCEEGYELNASTGKCEQIAYYKDILMCIFLRDFPLNSGEFHLTDFNGWGYNIKVQNMQRKWAYCVVKRWVDEGGSKKPAGAGIIEYPLVETNSPGTEFCSGVGYAFLNYVRKGDFINRANYVRQEIDQGTWSIRERVQQVAFLTYDFSKPAINVQRCDPNDQCHFTVPLCPMTATGFYPMSNCGNLLACNFLVY